MKQFTLFAIILLSFSALADVDANLIHPLLKIRNGVKSVRGQDAYVVRVSVDNGKKVLSNGSGKTTIDGETYRRALELSGAVLTVEAGHDRGTDPESVSFGTAFHVGGNLIMTNRHVLSPNQTNTTRCNGLKVKTADGRNSYNCQRVVYCNPTPVCSFKADIDCGRTADWCVIAVDVKSRGRFFKDLPVLPLRAERLADLSGAFSTVGNSGGYGLHFSESRTARNLVEPWRLGVRTRVFPGNSGGPLVNEANEVVGIIYARNNMTESYAVRMDFIIEQLKVILGEDNKDYQTIAEHVL